MSPRNQQRAAELAARFPDLVRVAPDNQAVLDASDVVFIGLLPAAAEEVSVPRVAVRAPSPRARMRSRSPHPPSAAAQTLPTLAFKPEHTVVSMMATKAHADIVRLTRMPGDRVTISVPLPTTQRRKGPVLMFPNHDLPRALYAAIGTPVPLHEEREVRADAKQSGPRTSDRRASAGARR